MINSILIMSIVSFIYHYIMGILSIPANIVFFVIRLVHPKWRARVKRLYKELEKIDSNDHNAFKAFAEKLTDKEIIYRYNFIDMLFANHLTLKNFLARGRGSCNDWANLVYYKRLRDDPYAKIKKIVVISKNPLIIYNHTFCVEQKENHVLAYTPYTVNVMEKDSTYYDLIRFFEKAYRCDYYDVVIHSNDKRNIVMSNIFLLVASLVIIFVNYWFVILGLFSVFYFITQSRLKYNVHRRLNGE